MRRAYPISNRSSAELPQAGFRHGRAAIVAAVAALGFMYAATLQAQSADDLKEQEVIAQRNADAAGAAWLKRMASAPSATAPTDGPAASVPTWALAPPPVRAVMPSGSSGHLNFALPQAPSVPAPASTETAVASASGRTKADAPAQASQPIASPNLLVVKTAARSTSEVANVATTMPAEIGVQTAARATQPMEARPVAASNAMVANVATPAPPPVKPAPTMQSMKPSAQTAPPATQSVPVPLVGGTAPGGIAAAPRQASVSEVKPLPAQVKYADGLLSIQANDASLNQILRQVSQLTGMVVAGGVAEERVFGNYGPARPSTVIAKLLDGIGSNMVLREGPNATVAELILTPRNGVVTPPRPSTIAAESSEANVAQINLQAQAGLAAATMRAESRATAAAYHPGLSPH